MKKQLNFLSLLLFSTFGFSQEIKFKEYSYSEFFKMIEYEPSDVFSLKNAAIVFDSITDIAHAKIGYLINDSAFMRKDTIKIKKALKLENIFFVRDPRTLNTEKYIEALYYLSFEEKVDLKNCFAYFDRCSFKKEVSIYFDTTIENMYQSYYNTQFNLLLSFEKSTFMQGIFFRTQSFEDKEIQVQFRLIKCDVWPSNNERISNFFNTGLISNFEISESTFYGDKELRIFSKGKSFFEITGNDFKDNQLELDLGYESSYQGFSLASNNINKPVLLTLGELVQENYLDWGQFKNGIINTRSFFNYIWNNCKPSNNDEIYRLYSSDSLQNVYLQTFRHTHKETFKAETKLLGKFQSHYNSQHDSEFENAVFMAIKDLETKRLDYLYSQDPSFDSYFKWKVNQFLKVFSAYGTEPSKAITFSVYVILFFAMIYLFFPNHWDSHGRNRILHRFGFFLKYIDKKSGMHDVYLEEKQEELMVYEEFKKLLEEKATRVPRFFISVGLPFYKWSISGTKLSATILKPFDIMNGTWNELPKNKRIWKSILLAGAFLIAVAYDIFIKMLNALMLSINTFTTLGFGEIPIKGLPRYLAIIQGFIGWFMLTIFSVSLISQLLN